METICRFLEILFLSYFFIYNSVNLFFVILSFSEVKRRVIGRAYEDLDMIMGSPFTPPISIIVPAYNEEKTIVESVRSLLNLKFPRFEIILVNDGSADETLRVLRDAFDMRRVDINYIEGITTAPVVGFYESKTFLKENIIRFVLVDKENGGKADALNCGINASLCPYFVSIDADSVIDDAALLQAFRVLLSDKNIIAIGGQVAILNGSEVEGGRITKVRLPKSWIARFQLVEYIRSFTLGRTALARLNCLLIISGVFGIFNKHFVERIGGYLTRFLTSKIANEFTGYGKETVCEDMEIIVRMHRYVKEKNLKQKIFYVPHPLCWTEAPEDLNNLSKQRNRWHRGLIETLLFHKKILFNPGYGRIGLFAFPYYALFELLGAPVEFFGYVTLPFLFYFDRLNFAYLFLFLAVSVGYGALISVASLVISAWPEKVGETDESVKTLIYFNNLKEIATLVLFAALENFGYRQATVFWRMKGTIDFFVGKKGWEKFERIGFEEGKREGSENEVPRTV
jgi:cellulose synthase/poly-beta-1,6-N-acetylglucosamine synthase-like glycosyltransferase